LSLLFGVNVIAVTVPVTYDSETGGVGETPPCGSVVSRYGLYKSWVPAIDEGWTRWILDHEGNRRCMGYSSVNDGDIHEGNLRAKYDTIIIPDQPRAAILNGHRKGTMPDEYTGGLGAEGVKALREFVEAGGTLVCLNRASDFAIEQFKLPVRDVVDGLPRTDFYVPGSILRIELDTNDAIAKGMPKESIAWAENSPVFEVTERSAGILPASLRSRLDEQFALRAHAGRDARAPDTSLLQAKIIAWYPKDKD